MNERERLVELLKRADDKCASTKQCENCVGFGKGAECVDFLIADYLLANGVIVPPCKIGQTVYRIVDMGTGIHYKQVGRCGIGHSQGYKIIPCEEKRKRFIRSVEVTRNNFFSAKPSFSPKPKPKKHLRKEVSNERT